MGVCARVHSWVKYEMRLHALADFNVEALVFYGANRQSRLPQAYPPSRGSIVLSGEDNLGVRDVYGDHPGEWTFMVIAEFPHQGSTSAYSAFLSLNIQSGAMSAECWQFKAQ